MARSSISASFNSDEIEAIDSICKKFVKKYPNAIQAMAETVVIDKKGKITFTDSVLSKHTKSFLAQAAYEIENGLSELDEEHHAYHALAKKKPKGRPSFKKKRGRPKM
jgi:hypothetical protein